MTTFDDLYTDMAEPILKSVTGQTVTYRDRGGTDSSITAIVGEERRREEASEDGRVVVREIDAVIYRDDVDDVDTDSSVIIDEVEWPVDEILARSGSQTTVRLIRIESAERSRPAYRYQA